MDQKPVNLDPASPSEPAGFLCDQRSFGSSGGRFLPFAFPGVPSVGCVFTTALAGTMSMDSVPAEAGQAAANRKSLLEQLGLRQWVELKQVHKDGVAVSPEPTPCDAPATREADGACTREKGLALLIKTADCQPLLLADIKGRAVAALHVGWRGNAMNFPATGLARFCEAYGLHPSEVLAVRGPSLGPAAAEFINFEREWSPLCRPWFNAARRTMDLWSLTRHQLTQAGVPAGQIFSLDLCTHSLPGLFFSHRRGHGGRQASLIWITTE